MPNDVVEVDLSEERILFMLKNNIEGMKMDIQYIKPLAKDKWKEYAEHCIEGIDFTFDEAQKAGLKIPQSYFDNWSEVKTELQRSF